MQAVYVAPGNGGTALDPRLENVDITDIPQLRKWALDQKIALTVVGPEGPLAAGVVDDFRAHGLRVFGPTKAAAQLESSKAFSKAFMKRHGIPTAEYHTFTDPAAAHDYVHKMGAPIVVKADGLAAGKGVVVAMTEVEAHEAIDFMLLDDKLGVSHNAGGARVVIEEFLQGMTYATFASDKKTVNAVIRSLEVLGELRLGKVRERQLRATRLPLQQALQRRERVGGRAHLQGSIRANHEQARRVRPACHVCEPRGSRGPHRPDPLAPQRAVERQVSRVDDSVGVVAVGDAAAHADGVWRQKLDPLAFHTEVPPLTASVVVESPGPPPVITKIVSKLPKL